MKQNISLVILFTLLAAPSGDCAELARYDDYEPATTYSIQAAGGNLTMSMFKNFDPEMARIKAILDRFEPRIHTRANAPSPGILKTYDRIVDSFEESKKLCEEEVHFPEKFEECVLSDFDKREPEAAADYRRWKEEQKERKRKEGGL